MGREADAIGEKMTSDAPTELLKQAVSLHRSEQFDEAKAIYQQILGAYPDNPDANHLFGILLIQLHHEEIGKSLINKAISLRGSYPEAELNLEALTGNSASSKVRLESLHIDTVNFTWEVPANVVGTWRHRRILNFASGFANSDHTWLTIGDTGGYDSYHLKEFGIRNVTPSSLNDKILRAGHDAGYIDDYLSINAECISLEDQSFDFVLCNQALHHMSRPAVAISEMLRVARLGVFLIEPQDPVIDLKRQRESLYWHDLKGHTLSICVIRRMAGTDSD